MTVVPERKVMKPKQCGSNPKPTLDVTGERIDTSSIVCDRPQNHEGLHVANGNGWTWTWKHGQSK